ncbi:MAG: phosphate regulon sensor histidine kinase PhoR [Alysiella sp.]|uniref:phosphate regulon sensor histidine kinase PhoR n=1 Tax=Alysiella sp. TaxID=1872483 RepID=UPI0026DC5DC8|nr:phosphate regulon sensor histidine kinase PhoR [Alysiella sp.]MDO4433305.1 phosphate regulon sensor histidine kinase PhoR [Alysiella sp.]
MSAPKLPDPIRSTSLYGHITSHSMLCLMFALLSYALGGAVLAWASIALYLALWLAHHLYHTAILLHHINPNTTPNTLLPEKNTLWGNLFAAINRREHHHHKQRQRLHRTLSLFQAAAEAIPNGIILLNRNQRIEWLNHTALSHYQLHPQQALGSSLKKQYPHHDLSDLLNNSDKQNEIRISQIQSNGINQHLRLVRLHLHNKKQLIISEDISQAEQLNATRTAFVANISHELRTPLTVINGFLETLHDTPNLPSEQQQQFIVLMQQESTRMLHLIHDLLTLSKLENHQIKPELRPLNLSQMAQQLLHAAQNLSGSLHTITLENEHEIWINAEERTLYQALSNLVFNAVRYTPQGGTISLILQQQNNPNPYKLPLVRFIVADNGMGIAAEHLPHLTDRFYRVDTGRSRENGGTGLGLAIAKHALAQNGTVLEIQSEVGKGSQFSAVFQTILPPISRQAA